MTRGEVVLFDWAYTDGTGSKMRPAVVVQADYLHGILDDTILVQITTTRHGIPGTEVELDPAVETASGLLHLSYAFCPNLLTADPAFIASTIGMLSDQAMRKIDECLKATLAIP
jgi:mRNA-degrading endonuclease toxin of MazEF toxin-antitoxin module